MNKADDKIITPSGASLIFGTKTTKDKLDIEVINEGTYSPYTIVVTEEDQRDDLAVLMETITNMIKNRTSLTIFRYTEEEVEE